MSTGKELSMIPEEVFIKSQDYVGDMYKYAQIHFDAHLRLLQKECPEFAV